MDTVEATAPSSTAPRRPIWVFLAVFVPLVAVYLLVPNPGLHPRGDHVDPLSNAVTAWHLGMRGTVILQGFEGATAPEYYRNIGWYVDSPRGPVSQYPPGAAAVGAPLYWLAGDPLTPKDMVGTNNPDAPPLTLPMPSVEPARVAASIAVAAAMGFLSLAVLKASGRVSLALGAAYVGGLATPMWPVAASALWQHGPGALWVALGVYLASRSSYAWAGLSLGAAVITRPHLAAVAAGLGLFVAWKERRWGPALQIGAGSAVGLAGLLAFNWWLWGRLTITGGYSETFAEQLGSGDFVWFAQNVFGALVDPRVGLLVISPFVVPLLLRIRPAWRSAPSWAKGAALGGILYLLIQLKANRYSGGDGFVGYRYPLEAMTAAGPLLALAYRHWTDGRRVAWLIFWGFVAIAMLRFILWWG